MMKLLILIMMVSIPFVLADTVDVNLEINASNESVLVRIDGGNNYSFTPGSTLNTQVTLQKDIGVVCGEKKQVQDCINEITVQTGNIKTYLDNFTSNFTCNVDDTVVSQLSSCQADLGGIKQQKDCSSFQTEIEKYKSQRITVGIICALLGALVYYLIQAKRTKPDDFSSY